jgi:pimeloyl-ACP methyl ester carboxylesterase
MHHEAREVLPQLLDAIGFRSGILFGHSDGASIAAIYGGAVRDPRVRGLVLMAPHFFTEDMGIAEIARAREAYATTELRRKLARWHDDVDNAFRGWNDAWLDPDFRKWDLTGELPGIRVPVLVVQGEADQYGTVAQVEAVQRLSGGPVEVALFPGVRHSPQRDAPDATLQAVAAFANRVLPGQDAVRTD